jgi:hypothetical protein
MGKMLNLFSQRTAKNVRKITPSRPIRRIGKTPKQTSKERYYKKKGIERFNDEINSVYTNITRKKINIG